MIGKEAGGIPPCTCAVTIHEGCFAYEPEVPDGAELRIEYCEQHERLEAAPRYCLVSDDDGHWYVVPAGKLEEWHTFIDAFYRWNEHEGVDPEPRQPDWVRELGCSPELLTFERPEVDGRPL